jgi:hypothetical protein
MSLTDFFKPNWKNSDPVVRKNAIAQMHDSKAISYLTNKELITEIALIAKDENVRKFAVLNPFFTDLNIIGKIASTDGDLGVRLAALSKIKIQLENKNSKSLRILAIELLGSIKSAQAAKMLIDALSNENDDEILLANRNAIIAIGSDAIEPLITALKDSSKSSKINAAELIGAIDQSILARIAKAAKDLNSKVRKSAVEYLTNQSDVVDIAKTESDIEIRVAAVKRIIDQSVLFEITKNDKHALVGLSAVENPNLTDQKILSEIAINYGNNHSVGSAALKKLTNKDILNVIRPYIFPNATESIEKPELLLRIFRIAGDPKVRKAAVQNPNFTDQNLLAEIAQKDENSYVRLAAVEKLTNQSALSEIINKETDNSVRETAKRRYTYLCINDLKKLTDQKILAEIAKKDENRDLRLAAVTNLTDQSLLLEIVKASDDLLLQEEAVNNPNFTDQSALLDLAKSSAHLALRKAAIKKISEQAVLIELIKSSDYKDLHSTAIINITDQAVLKEILKSADYKDIHSAAIQKITDQKLIIEVVKSSEHEYLKSAATRVLTDQTLLTEIAETDESYATRMALVHNLNFIDLEMIARIAKTDSHFAVRNAAASRIHPGNVWCPRCSDWVHTVSSSEWYDGIDYGSSYCCYKCNQHLDY